MDQKQLVLALTAALLFVTLATASDPETVKDFAVPEGVNASTITSDFFTFTGFRGGVAAKPGTFGIKPMNVNQLPSLAGLGVSFALLEFHPGTVNVPHIHPRGTELLFLLSGTLDVGFVDSTKKLFEKRLMQGDVFVFPKGLMHFQINRCNQTVATAIASFSSSNPGLVSLPSTLFASGISEDLLIKSFKASGDVVKQLENALKS